MNKQLEQLVKEAESAIDAVFGFTEVSKEETLEAMEDLGSLCEGNIESLQSEIDKEAEEEGK